MTTSGSRVTIQTRASPIGTALDEKASLFNVMLYPYGCPTIVDAAAPVGSGFSSRRSSRANPNRTAIQISRAGQPFGFPRPLIGTTAADAPSALRLLDDALAAARRRSPAASTSARSGSACRWVYLFVVCGLAWPSTRPIMGRLAPLATSSDAIVCRKS